MSHRLIHTITLADVGTMGTIKEPCACCGHVRTYSMLSALGRIRKCDIGKRVYLVDGTVQVENVPQMEARLARDGSR